MSNSVGIIIPSYNEQDNLRLLLKNIYAVTPHAQIVIVDDSDKKESRLLKRFVSRQKNRRISLISRGAKLGRGSAVLVGFKEMLKNKSVVYFFEMDADLAHDPKDCAVLLNTMRSQKADLVVGSRYMAGSSIVDWPLKRLILSKLINWLIHRVLGLNLTDYTNGFRVYSRRAIEYLTCILLKETGFIALSEMAYQLKKKNYTIAEVPITFTDRKLGKSSADLREFYQSLIGLFRIRLSL